MPTCMLDFRCGLYNLLFYLRSTQVPAGTTHTRVPTLQVAIHYKIRYWPCHQTAFRYLRVILIGWPTTLLCNNVRLTLQPCSTKGRQSRRKQHVRVTDEKNWRLCRCQQEQHARPMVQDQLLDTSTAEVHECQLAHAS